MLRNVLKCHIHPFNEPLFCVVAMPSSILHKIKTSLQLQFVLKQGENGRRLTFEIQWQQLMGEGYTVLVFKEE